MYAADGAGIAGLSVKMLCLTHVNAPNCKGPVCIAFKYCMEDRAGTTKRLSLLPMEEELFANRHNRIHLHPKHANTHSQRAHDVIMTPYQRRCNVMTSHRRRFDVILTSSVCWVTTLNLLQLELKKIRKQQQQH